MTEKVYNRFIITTDNYTRYIAKLGTVKDENGKVIPIALSDNNEDAIPFCTKDDAQEFIYRAAKKLGRPDSDFEIGMVEMIKREDGIIGWY